MISIIIPVYNGEQYLRACLDSVLVQTYRELEVIVINDGSKDASLEICEEYARKDPRVRVFSQENAGVSAARNRGLAEANGEYIMFVDADDLIPADICRFAAERAENYDMLFFDRTEFWEESALDSGRVECLNSKTKELSTYSKQDWMEAVLGNGYATDGLRLYAGMVWGKLYRRSFLQKAEAAFPVDVPLGEDQLFNLQVLLKQPAARAIPVNAYYYRYNEASAVHSYNPRFRLADQRHHAKLEEILRAEGFLEFAGDEMAYRRAGGLIHLMSRDIFHKDNPKTEEEKRADLNAVIESGVYPQSLKSQTGKFGLFHRMVLLLALDKQYGCLKAVYAARNAFVAIRNRLKSGAK